MNNTQRHGKCKKAPLSPLTHLPSHPPRLPPACTCMKDTQPHRTCKTALLSPHPLPHPPAKLTILEVINEHGGHSKRSHLEKTVGAPGHALKYIKIPFQKIFGFLRESHRAFCFKKTMRSLDILAMSPFYHWNLKGNALGFVGAETLHLGSLAPRCWLHARWYRCPKKPKISWLPRSQAQ